MSKSASSPTARLLQSSRLFSLPRPLPPAPLDTASANVYRSSQSATSPYPTHQAIVTPASSHHRGDWGLKRALPKRAAVRDGSVRITAQDTTEHITDFGSAGEHVRTLVKWHEMGLPMLMRRVQVGAVSQARPTSAFDEWVDITQSGELALQQERVQEALQMQRTQRKHSTLSTQQHQQREQQEQEQREPLPQRWKHSGPWIAGLQPGEFEQYLSMTIARRKDEWRDYLRKILVERNLVEAQRQAQIEGRPLSAAARQTLRQQLRPTDGQLAQEEKSLRDAHTVEGLTSRLTTYICTFLDLPSVRPVEITATDTIKTDELQKIASASLERINDVDSAPPSTHPSAGLSHLRTGAIMSNHPIWGPQAHRTPVLARVLTPRSSSRSTETQARLGVGGFVTLDPIGGGGYRSAYPAYLSASGTEKNRIPDPETMAEQLDPDMHGGNKMWVHPLSAWVDERGHVRVDVIRGEKEAIAVGTGDVEHVLEARAGSRMGPTYLQSLNARGPGGASASTRPSASGNGWGLGPSVRLPGSSLPPPPPTRSLDRGLVRARDGQEGRLLGRTRTPTQGFDGALGRREGAAQMGESEQMTRIQELLKGAGAGSGRKP